MIKELTRLANHLDSIGLLNEANYLDNIIKKASEYPQEFRIWVRNRILDGHEGPSYQRALKEYSGQKMARVGAWLKGSFSAPQGAQPLDIDALKSKWLKSKEESQPQEGDGVVQLDLGEVRDLTKALEQSGEQLSLFS